MPNIIGIGNSQAPTNAMLGGLAYQDSVGEIDIDKIKARVSDTATDIFVYDTRKDSDGGAWRHRTQKTSWYNEPSAGISSHRGPRKEFPAVAVIVAEQSPNYKVTIYDGDDPNLSLWMQWIYRTNDPFLDYSSPGSHHLGNYAPYALSAMNGIVCVGTLRSAGHLNNLNAGLREFHFIEDTCFATNNDKRVRFPTSIADRNVVTVDYKQVSPNIQIANTNVNDVAMTVLPNAPIDEISGLPRPTIAVATDGGVSVIRDSKLAADSDTGIYGRPFVKQIKFKGERLIGHVHQTGNTGDGVLFMETVNEIPFPEGTDTRYPFFVSSDSALSLDAVDTKGTHPIEVASKNVIAGGNNGIGIIEEKKDSPTNGIIAHIAKDFNTGWQQGDIKGAFLSSTDTTDVNADTLNSAGNFDSTFSTSTGWGGHGGSNDWTISGGVASCNGNNTQRFLYPGSYGWTEGTSVVVEVTVTAYTSGTLNVSFDTGNAAAGTDMTATGTYKFVGTVSGNQAVYLRSASFIGSVDNVKIYIAEFDRSINNNGLIPYGTITKSVVATGAELTAYSGFSNSNYLQQDLNSDLQFGTGDWAFYGWYDDTGGAGARTIFELGRSVVTGDHIGVRNDGTNLELFISDDSFGSQDVAEFSSSAASGWQFSCALRRGNKIELWNNGVLKASTLITNATGNLGDSETYLRFGNRTYTSQPWDGSLALWRVSKSAPSPEQILKMYYDEKCLFQENAKATLYGTSSNITGLAYDDSNNVVHVGTSSGRSEFQGLNRINNTTTAVTTAISASNGLVAEQ